MPNSLPKFGRTLRVYFEEGIFWILRPESDVISVQSVRLAVFGQLTCKLHDVVNRVLRDLGESECHLVINSFLLAQAHAQLFEVDQGVVRVLNRCFFSQWRLDELSVLRVIHRLLLWSNWGAKRLHQTQFNYASR